jgi:hypothetical protein
MFPEGSIYTYKLSIHLFERLGFENWLSWKKSLFKIGDTYPDRQRAAFISIKY